MSSKVQGGHLNYVIVHEKGGLGCSIAKILLDSLYSHKRKLF